MRIRKLLTCARGIRGIGMFDFTIMCFQSPGDGIATKCKYHHSNLRSDFRMYRTIIYECLTQFNTDSRH